MFKVLSNLKKSIFSVIVIVLLLCVQAWADLELPSYTSKIVNVGIQAGGIENVAPEVIRKSQMDVLLLFTNEDEYILGCYELENDSLAKYALKDLSKQELTKLDEVIQKPLTLAYTITNEQMSNEFKNQFLQSMPENQKLLFEDKSFIEILNNLPEEAAAKIIEQVNTSMEQKLGTMLSQLAITATKEEYKSLGINTDEIQNKYILLAGVQMLAIAGISMVCAVVIILLSSRVAAMLGKTLREKVFKKVLDFSIEEFRNFSTASLITRSTNDIMQIQMLITMLFRVVVYAPIIGIGGFLRVLGGSDTSMAWIIGLAILCIVGIILTLFMIAMPKFKKLQELIDKLNLVSREILTGLPVIRAFHTEEKEEKRFEDANTDLMKTNIFVNRAMSIMMPALMFVMNSIMLLIVWVGGHNVDKGIMQVGDMMTFIQYTMQIVISFLVISMMSIMLPRAAVSAKRINEVLETEPKIKDIDKPKKFDETKKGVVEFKNVSFRYPDAAQELLTDINFTAMPGKTTAIIGSTGSGKSTIVNLIPRFYDVTGGELLIDGINIKEVPQKELREKIGFVPQKGVLFSGTIESNIKYSNENMSFEDMEKAAIIAQATEFIEAKEEKYKHEIAQGGNNVSGGQKQRLSIARAIAKNPEIFIFDDSFSALDLKTDANLRAALSEITKNKTVIIVAQRISTILNADQIIVLEEGKVVGIGTHEELMKNCETYSQIAKSQLENT